MLLILVVPLALAMPPPNVTVTTTTTTTTERNTPPINAFINNRHVSTQLIPTTSKRRILSLKEVPLSHETWPPPPPPPLEARPPTTAPTGPPIIIRSTSDPNDIDTKIVKQDPRELKAKKRRKKIKKLSKILKRNKKMLKKLLAVKHERDQGRGIGKKRGKGRGKERGKGTAKGTAKEMGKGTGNEMGRSRTHRPRASWGSSDDTEFDDLVAQQKKKGHVKDNNADKYDTIHAKGGKISYMRLKGRVCQRSILNVEGPKYNRAGGEYKPVYQDKKSYFSNTKAPHLLLPRCCNCCKKSALGCE